MIDSQTGHYYPDDGRDYKEMLEKRVAAEARIYKDLEEAANRNIPKGLYGDEFDYEVTGGNL